MKRKCLQCGCDLPDSVRGLFCDDECEEKFTEQYENSKLPLPKGSGFNPNDAKQ